MKKNFNLPPCPVETTLLFIDDRWKTLILRDLFMGIRRFGQIKKSLAGISQKVLTQKLKKLEANGLIKRKVYAEVPPRVEYSLTDLGNSIKTVIDAMWKWGEKFKKGMEPD